jgi:type I restriction enzyme S subunit
LKTEYITISERPVQLWISASLFEDRLDAEFYQPVYLRALESIESTPFPVRPLVDTSVEKFRVWWGIKGLTYPPSVTHILYIRPNEVADDGWIEYESLTTIERHWADEMPGAVVKPGDLLVEVKGNARKVHIVRDDVPPLTFVSGSMYRFVPRDEVDAHYLWAYLTGNTCQTIKGRLMSNSIIKWINPEDICQLPVLLPPQPVQEYIGAKVRLAERCRERARELWETSQRILSEALGIPLDTGYFERIDLGELQTPSYQLVRVRPMAAWVQTDLVEHELGPQYFHPRRANVILKLRSSDVELKRLTDVARRRSDRVSAAQVGQVRFYVGLADIDSTTGYFDPVSLQKAGISGTSALFKTGDILFSKLRPYLNKVSICPSHISQACGSTELLIYRAYKAVLPYYVFFVVKSSIGLYQILDVTTGSTLPRVNPEVVDDMLVPMIQAEHQQVIDSNVQQVLALHHQSSQLVREAKADVEALIEGRLDVDGIVAGRVRPLAWEEIAPA